MDQQDVDGKVPVRRRANSRMPFFLPESNHLLSCVGLLHETYGNARVARCCFFLPEHPEVPDYDEHIPKPVYPDQVGEKLNCYNCLLWQESLLPGDGIFAPPAMEYYTSD